MHACMLLFLPEMVRTCQKAPCRVISIPVSVRVHVSASVSVSVPVLSPAPAPYGPACVCAWHSC